MPSGQGTRPSPCACPRAPQCPLRPAPPSQAPPASLPSLPVVCIFCVCLSETGRCPRCLPGRGCGRPGVASATVSLGGSLGAVAPRLALFVSLLPSQSTPGALPVRGCGNPGDGARGSGWTPPSSPVGRSLGGRWRFHFQTPPSPAPGGPPLAGSLQPLSGVRASPTARAAGRPRVSARLPAEAPVTSVLHRETRVLCPGVWGVLRRLWVPSFRSHLSPSRGSPSESRHSGDPALPSGIKDGVTGRGVGPGRSTPLPGRPSRAPRAALCWTWNDGGLGRSHAVPCPRGGTPVG